MFLIEKMESEQNFEMTVVSWRVECPVSRKIRKNL